ncbi:MAG: hypothetical protein DMF60_19500 [Acidobacteria bacterium]|nr:MAG: hypothetical protein DMF60_19500 [Acidobacteriota bacterium]
MVETAKPEEPGPPEANPVGLWPVWDFAVHVAVGTLIFAVIGSAAVALDLVSHKLQSFGVDAAIGYGLKAAEYALFTPI